MTKYKFDFSRLTIEDYMTLQEIARSQRLSSDLFGVNAVSTREATENLEKILSLMQRMACFKLYAQPFNDLQRIIEAFGRALEDYMDAA